MDSLHHASPFPFAKESVGRNDTPAGCQNFLPFCLFLLTLSKPSVDGQNFRMAKTRKPGTDLLWDTQSPRPTEIQRGQWPYYPERTLHSHHFHLGRQPGLCLSAWEHAHPIKLLAQSPHHFGAEQLTHPKQLLDTAQSQPWACPMCQNRHRPWLRGQLGCSTATHVGEAIARRHQRSIWRFGSSAVTGDLEPLLGMC